MSFSAILTLKGSRSGASGDIFVRKYNILFRQPFDEHTGKPTSKVIGGIIRLEVESGENDAFTQWMISNHETCDGEITFKKIDEDGTYKKVEFKTGFCVEYEEDFDAHGGGFILRLSISAGQIDISGQGKAAQFDREWKS